MSIWAFLTQAEIDDAPDGEEGFAQLVRVAQERLDQRLSQFDREDNSGWNRVAESEMMFSRTVLNLGKGYGIEPFASMQIPREGYNTNEYTEFRHELDDAVAHLVLTNAINLRRDTMIVPNGVKEAIRTHLHHIREHLEKADISDAKRAALKRKLDEFDAALEKNRFNYLAAGRVAMEILSLTANVLSVAESATVHKLLTNMMQTVAEAKAEDDEKRNLPSSDPPPVMLPAKREEPKVVNGPREDFSADLDDEIPF
jgi:hypothetical protein